MEIHDAEDFCFPHLLNTSCRKPVLSTVSVVFLRALLSLICVITVTLNLLVIISVSHFRQLHNATNFLLLSLSVSDFLVGLVYVPGETVKLTACWFLGDHMCLLYTYIISIIVSASTGNTVLISVERYVAICDPLHYASRITVRRVQTCICLCWLCAVLYGISFVKDGLEDLNTSCSGKCVLLVDFFAVVFDLLVTFFIPVTVIIFLYIRVFVIVVFQVRALRSRISTVTVTPSSRTSELKAARTLGVLVVVFLICFCPYYCAALAGDNSLSASATVFCFFSINSCSNPVIYTLFHHSFIKAVKHIVTLKILKPGSFKANIL